MGRKRKRQDDDDYVDFCSGLQRSSKNGVGDRSYIYSESRPYKRPKVNPNFYKPGAVKYRYVDPNESIYQEIASKITNNSIVIDELMEVKNPILEDAYNATRKQKVKIYGRKVAEELLFHGTKEKNVPSICTFNFDWRLNGSNKGHKFGKGVCFSRNAKYASNYSDHYSYNKVMIVAKVLIGEVCQGHHDMSIPPQGYDTSQKGDNGVVLVKYEDNEFYPAYILYYHFRDIHEDRHYSYYKYNREYYTYNETRTYNFYFNKNHYCNSVFYFDSNDNNNHYSYYDINTINVRVYKDEHYNNYKSVRYNQHFYNSQNNSDFADDSYNNDDQPYYYSFD